MTRTAIVALLASLAACGDDAASPADTALAVDSTLADADLAPDSAVAADSAVASDAVDDSVAAGCVPGVADGCASVEWLQVDDYPRATDHHTTLVHTTGADTWLYVVGGATLKDDLTAYDQVRRAEIGGDGMLGAWEDEAPLPAPVAFAGQATLGDRVWVVAGITQDDQGAAAANEALLGTFDGDGHLSFAPTTSLPAEVRVHPTAHALRDRVVVVGGSGGADEKPVDTVLVADIDADGELGAWRPGPTLPGERSHHAGVVHDDRIYLFGGFDLDNEPIEAIWRSVHDADGEPTGWEVAGSMTDPPWTHAATLYKDGVLIVGGGQGGPGEEHYVDRVRWARFAADGSVGTFVDAHDPLPRARSHVHQVPLHNGFLYSVGGRSDRSLTSIPDVFVGYLAF